MAKSNSPRTRRQDGLAEGKFTKIELTREQAVALAREEAEDRGKKFDPTRVKGGMTLLQIQGTGAVILSN